jgi:hypothetical protein
VRKYQPRDPHAHVKAQVKDTWTDRHSSLGRKHSAFRLRHRQQRELTAVTHTIQVVTTLRPHHARAPLSMWLLSTGRRANSMTFSRWRCQFVVDEGAQSSPNITGGDGSLRTRRSSVVIFRSTADGRFSTAGFALAFEICDASPGTIKSTNTIGKLLSTLTVRCLSQSRYIAVLMTSIYQSINLSSGCTV